MSENLDPRLCMSGCSVTVSIGEDQNIPIDGSSVPIAELRTQLPALRGQELDYLISDAAFFWWPGTAMVSCTIRCKNNHVELGSSCPIDDTDFQNRAGLERAFNHALDGLYKIHAYHVRSAK